MAHKNIKYIYLKRSYFVALAGPELTMQTRLASKSQRSTSASPLLGSKACATIPGSLFISKVINTVLWPSLATLLSSRQGCCETSRILSASS